MKLSLKPNKHDIFVGSFLLVFLVALIISLTALKSSDDTQVFVKYDGQIVHTMDLNQDEVFIMHEEEYKNLQGDFEVTVKDGKVSITKNTCPQDFCKHLGEIDSKGYSLICSPNRVVVEIGSKVQSDCDWGVCDNEG